MTNVFALTSALCDADFRRRMAWAGYGFVYVRSVDAYQLARVPK